MLAAATAGTAADAASSCQAGAGDQAVDALPSRRCHARHRLCFWLEVGSAAQVALVLMPAQQPQGALVSVFDPTAYNIGIGMTQ